MLEKAVLEVHEPLPSRMGTLLESGPGYSFGVIFIMSVFLRVPNISPLSSVRLSITGHSVMDVKTSIFPELICSFQFLSEEFDQIDVKWFLTPDEEPFLQWVPASGKEPQAVGKGS